MKRITKLFGLVSSVAFAALFFAGNAKATTYTFSGNTTYTLGLLPLGDSSFSVTDATYIPYPVGSNHTTSDSFGFSLAADSWISVTFVSGLYTAPDYMNLCSSSFCYSSGTSNVSAFLTAGDYALGVIALIPSAPEGTGPLNFETYGGDIVVGINATPLPSTWFMLLSGFVGLGFFAYRGSRKRATRLAAA